MSDSLSPSTTALEVTKVLGHGGAVGTDRRVELHAVTGTDDGGLVVAVGGNGCGSGAAAWYSTDGGRTWRAARGALGGGGNQGEMRGVTTAAQGLVAVGHDGGGAAVWTSKDGTVWQRAAVGDPALAGPATTMTAVVAFDGGLVAVGQAPPGPGPGPLGAAVWTSTDAQRWARVRDRSLEQPLGVPGAVIAGGEGLPGLVMIGIAGFPLLDQPFPVPDRPAVWTSQDGRRWTAVALPVAATQPGSTNRLEGVVRVGAGLVAVGGEQAARRASGEGFRPLVWTSRDGHAWQSATPPRSEGDESVLLRSVASTGAVVVALGVVGTVEDGDLAGWRWSDVGAWQRIVVPAAVAGGWGMQVAQAAWTLPDGSILAVGFDGTFVRGRPAIWLIRPRR